jgi:glutathione synthase/RimK-type ligase-like ATP-grasp enzyme
MSISGADLQATAQEMLAQTANDQDNANLWMNLSTVTLCLGHRDAGLALQATALELSRVYHLAAAQQPAQLRLLMLMAPGDLAANTPLDCLLENSDIDLDLYYLSPNAALPPTLPEHDVLIVGLSELDEHRHMLDSLEQALAHWPRPVINAPQYIPNTGRSRASELLQHAPGLLIPPTMQISRSELQAIASGAVRLPEQFDDCDFPVILRPMGSHAGRDLEKIDAAQGVATYLEHVHESDFFLSRFIDYSDPDGLFRKFRIALIDGQSFACHMAVSSHWMVHYVNAGMYEDAQKRAEEAQFMQCFDEFFVRHSEALKTIAQRTQLDYLCIDCAQTPSGELLVFEIDHAMVVHAMDSEQLFPHKQTHMLKVKTAFRELLLRLQAASAASTSKTH